MMLLLAGFASMLLSTAFAIAPEAPAAPTAVANNAKATVTWTAPTGVPRQYWVQKATVPGGTYSDLSGCTAITYGNMCTGTGLTNGTSYFFKVKASDAVSGGTWSAYSMASAPVTPTASIILASPTALAISNTGPSPSTALVLTWTAPAVVSPATAITAYEIKWSTVAGGNYSSITTASTGTTYTHTGLKHGTRYYYRIAARNASGETAQFPMPPAGEIAGIAVGPPDAPTGVAVYATNSQIDLTWKDTFAATTYTVNRGMRASGPFTALAGCTNVSGASCHDGGLVNDKSYYYVVNASNAAGTSVNSMPPVEGIPVSPPAAAPSALTATAGGARVTLSWKSVTSATSYNLKRRLKKGAYDVIYNGIASTYFVDVGLQNGTTYYYAVSASNAGGESANSSPVQEATPAAPAGPWSLAAAAGNGRIDVFWLAPSDATSFTLKRGTSPGYYTTIFPDLPLTKFSDTQVINGTTYYYVVSANTADGVSLDNPEGEYPATPLSTPSAPINLSAVSIAGQVSLSWDWASLFPPNVRYTIRRGTVSGGPYTTIYSWTYDKSYVDKTVANGTMYYYVVTAEHHGGTSVDSSEVLGNPGATVAWNAQANFDSNGQGANQWSYLYSLDGGRPMVANVAGRAGWWGVDWGANAWCYIASNQQHPGGKYDSIRRWTAPYQGVVSISGISHMTNAYAGDGANITIRVNGKEIWTALVASADTTVGVSWSLNGRSTRVNSGDTVDTVVNRQGTHINDEQYLLQDVAYQVLMGNRIAPGPPGSVAVTAGHSRVTLSWAAVPAATTYTVKRGTRSGDYNVTYAPVSGQSYTDTTTTNGTRYFYVVNATDAVGRTSLNSIQVNAVPFFIPPPPGKPTNLKAVESGSTITLSWAAGAGATGYKIERAFSAMGPFTPIVENQPGSPFANVGLLNQIRYHFRVYSTNAGGSSAPATVSAKTSGAIDCD